MTCECHGLSDMEGGWVFAKGQLEEGSKVKVTETIGGDPCNML